MFATAVLLAAMALSSLDTVASTRADVQPALDLVTRNFGAPELASNEFTHSFMYHKVHNQRTAKLLRGIQQHGGPAAVQL